MRKTLTLFKTSQCNTKKQTKTKQKTWQTYLLVIQTYEIERRKWFYFFCFYFLLCFCFWLFLVFGLVIFFLHNDLWHIEHVFIALISQRAVALFWRLAETHWYQQHAIPVFAGCLWMARSTNGMYINIVESRHNRRKQVKHKWTNWPLGTLIF